MPREGTGHPSFCLGLATDGWVPYPDLSAPDGNPVLMHYVDGIELCGLRMHVTAYRTYLDDSDFQQTYDAAGMNALEILDEGGRFETVTIEGYPGDWVIFCTPFCE